MSRTFQHLVLILTVPHNSLAMCKGFQKEEGRVFVGSKWIGLICLINFVNHGKLVFLLLSDKTDFQAWLTFNKMCGSTKQVEEIQAPLKGII